MQSLVSLEGINEAINNLELKENTLKSNLVLAIQSYFPDEEALLQTKSIPAEELVKKLWGVDSPEEIRLKRKNLSSLKSALNKNLKDLDKEGKNPEGIIVGRDNVFIVSSERKDDLIKQLGLSAEPPKSLKEMFAAFKNIFSEMVKDQGIDDVKDLIKELDETKKTVQELTGLKTEDAESAPEEAKKLPDEEIEEISEADIEKVEEDEDLDEIEEIPEEELEDVEEIPDEEIEEISEADIEEVEEDEDLDEIEEIPEEELEDVEEIPEEEIEEIPEADIEEVEEDEDLDEIEEIPEEELEDVEEIPEEEIEEIPEADIEKVEEDEDLDEIEEIPEEELEDVEEIPEEEIEEIPEADIEEVEEDEDLDEIEEIPEEEIEEIPEADIEEVEEDEDLDEIEEIPEEELEDRSPLEALSKYLDAEEALIDDDHLLHESDEEYTAQILDRYMPKYIKIPSGEYIIGSSKPKPLEQPQKSVSLKEFYMGQIPVTNDLFDLFVRETGYVTDAETAGYGVVFEGRCSSRIDPITGHATLTLSRGTTSHQVNGANWRHPLGPGSNIENKHNHPVVQISRSDAMAFAAWAGKRLPSEDEWEAAARGKNGQLFPWGDMWTPKLANFETSCTGETTSVEYYGRPSMSPYGLLDMLGNVYEWTSTLYHKKSSSEPGSDRKIYILKGGCWTSTGIVSVCHRMIERENYWSNTIGFRCTV